MANLSFRSWLEAIGAAMPNNPMAPKTPQPPNPAKIRAITAITGAMAKVLPKGGKQAAQQAGKQAAAGQLGAVTNSQDPKAMVKGIMDAIPDDDMQAPKMMKKKMKK